MIELRNISIDLGEFHLENISLEIRPGEYLVLLGPTGVGKTVLVECIVGIYRPQAGQVLVDRADVTHLNPEDRNIAYVPQDYALFPNMTVRQNLGYGLRARRVPADQVAKKVDGFLDRLDLELLADRMPLNLSGGEKQRVALGRALATDPRILLLDEPLGALDESTRAQLAAELRRIHRDFGATFLHVCHNFEETAEVADRVAILNGGRIHQVGTVEEILNRPADRFVAEFTRTENILPAHAAGRRLTVDHAITLVSEQSASGEVLIAVRPEHIEILSSQANGEPNVLEAQVRAVTLKGSYARVELEAGIRLVAHVMPPAVASLGLQEARHVWLRIPPARVRIVGQEKTP